MRFEWIPMGMVMEVSHCRWREQLATFSFLSIETVEMNSQRPNESGIFIESNGWFIVGWWISTQCCNTCCFGYDSYCFENSDHLRWWWFMTTMCPFISNGVFSRNSGFDDGNQFQRRWRLNSRHIFTRTFGFGCFIQWEGSCFADVRKNTRNQLTKEKLERKLIQYKYIS